MSKSIYGYVAIPKSRRSIRFDDLFNIVQNRKDFTTMLDGMPCLGAFQYNPKFEKIVKVKITLEED